MNMVRIDFLDCFAWTHDLDWNYAGYFLINKLGYNLFKYWKLGCPKRLCNNITIELDKIDEERFSGIGFDEEPWK